MRTLSRTQQDSFAHAEPVPNISAVLAVKRDGSLVLAWHGHRSYTSVGY